MKYLRGFFGINYCSDGTFNVQLKEHFYGVLCFVVIKTVGKQAVVKQIIVRRTMHIVWQSTPQVVLRWLLSVSISESQMA